MEAKKLWSEDDSGTSDSFVEIQLITRRSSFRSSFKQQNKTSTTSIVKSLNPVWNEMLEL